MFGLSTLIHVWMRLWSGLLCTAFLAELKLENGRWVVMNRELYLELRRKKWRRSLLEMGLKLDRQNLRALEHLMTSLTNKYIVLALYASIKELVTDLFYDLRWLYTWFRSGIQCISMHSTNNVQNSAQLCLTIFVVHAPTSVHKVIIHETRIKKISIFKFG